MKNRSTIIIAILLVASIGSYFNVVSDGTIRTVEFINIFAMGTLTGLLIMQISKSRN